ncbi:hypothetical protein F3Y22_tig00009107pilonHSYRG00008 [Hibiscus syriacus]|uniref:Uncharacterized protein n=1 Tax=Hibiscus syriacus TaxID=106335 RepID=A0A6A3C828_HIBSY|nr:hypothetical protein F3Y22_tig00009107pilonHSYRG00008 [Hibiscus syriacus]
MDNSGSEKQTYASMVGGSKNTNGEVIRMPDFIKDEVIVAPEDIIMGHRGTIPSIQFSNRVHEQIDSNMRNAIIVRLLGRAIGYKVRLSGLPYRYYNKALFRHIASFIGRVIKIDYNTDAGGREKFARLTIIEDLTKPLLSCIRIDGILQKLEYEGLQNIYYECGVYGHTKEISGARKDSIEGNAIRSVERPETSVPAKTEIYKTNLFGPWMLVTNRRKRTGINRQNVGVDPSTTPYRLRIMGIQFTMARHCLLRNERLM